MTDLNHSNGLIDVRPAVARTPSNRPIWIFGGAVAFAGLGLFAALETRRTIITSPVIAQPVSATDSPMAPPPELVIPRMIDPGPSETSTVRKADTVYSPTLPVQRPSPQSWPRPMGIIAYQPPPSYSAPASQPVQPPTPAFIYQAPTMQPSAAITGLNEKAREDGRISAYRLSNPSTTISQGTVVQAVLETALDSNRAGFVRAIVSRDVSSFDGSHMLIPRGSRLFGEYKADLTPGQNRALIQWHRLTRPDGVVLDIDSPSADPLGRAGIKGKVNSHFFARFGGALLQTVLDIGAQVATRRATGGTVIYALPSSAPQLAISKPEDVRPTLTVKEGTSVSVMVVHDLDFTDVEN